VSGIHKDAASGFVGYVLRFAVRSEYLALFEVQKVGSLSALELWISAEPLAEFIQHVVGEIEVVSTCRASLSCGPADVISYFPAQN
jgi:hypothetical protein